MPLQPHTKISITNESKSIFQQLLKGFVILASIVGAGFALRYIFMLFGRPDADNHDKMDQTLVPQQHSFPPFLTQQPDFSIGQVQLEMVDRLAVAQNTQTTVPIVAMLQMGSVNTGEQANGVALNANESLAFVSSIASGFNVVDVSNPIKPVLKWGIIVGGLNLNDIFLDVALNANGTLAFVVSELGLKIINVSNPSNPVLIGSLGTINNDNFYNVALNANGTLVFAATYWGLKIVDVSKPSRPVLMGSLVLGSGAHRVALNTNGTLAFVAAGNSGLKIVDASNSSNPVLRGSLVVGGYAAGVALNTNGTLAFMATYSGLKIIDVSNSSSPVLLGSIGGSSEWVALNTNGTLAFVVTSQAFEIINVSNPSNPMLMGSLVVGMYTKRVALNAAETLAFVTDTFTTQLSKSILRIIDVSNASNPILRGSLGTGGAHGVAMNANGTLAFMAYSSGLKIIDVSNPNLVIAAQNIRLNAGRTLAFVASDVLGLKIINVSNASKPMLSGGLITGGNAYGVALNTNETLAFVTTNLGLKIIDVSNPSSLVLRGSFVTNWIVYGIALNAAGTLAFVMDSSRPEFSELKIIDVSNQLNPVLIGSLFTTALTNGNKFFNCVVLNAAETLVFVTMDTKLNIIDVSNPSDPVLKGQSLTTDPYATAYTYGVALNAAETLAFVTSSVGLSVINVSNSNSPALIGLFFTSNAYGVILNAAKTLAFVADNGGLKTILLTYALQSSLPNLLVGKNLEGKIIDGISPDHTIKNIYSINAYGNRGPLPYWFSIDRTAYNGSLIFSGVPTKDYSGTSLVLEIQVLSPDAILLDTLNYPRITLLIKPSLIINVTASKLSIQSPASMAALTIDILNVTMGRFVLDSFGAVSLSFDRSLGQLSAIGTISGLNGMLQKLRFSLDDVLLSNSSALVTADDSVNVPQSVVVPITKFTFNVPPYVFPGALLPNRIVKPGKLFSFVIPNVFGDPDDTELTLSSTLTNGSSLPSWLGFNPINRQFSGITPDSAEAFNITLTASDSAHLNASTTFQLTIGNALPLVPVLAPFKVKPASAFDFQLNRSAFSDSDGDPVMVSVMNIRNVNGTIVNVPWLTFNLETWEFSGQAPLDAMGKTYRATLRVSDGTGFVDTPWVLEVRDNQAPIWLRPFAKQVTTTNDLYRYQIPSNFILDPNNDTVSYSATESGKPGLPAWLDFDTLTRVFSGKPSVENLGTYLIEVMAKDEFEATNRTTLTLEVRRSWLDTFAYVLEIAGPILTVLAAAYAVYEKYPDLWNALARSKYHWEEIPKDFLNGRPYTPQRKNGDIIPADEIKQVKIVQTTEAEGVLKKCKYAMPSGLFHNLTHEPIPASEDALPAWVTYNHETNKLQFLKDNIPADIRGKYTLKVLGDSNKILQQMDFDIGKILTLFSGETVIDNEDDDLSILGQRGVRRAANRVEPVVDSISVNMKNIEWKKPSVNEHGLFGGPKNDEPLLKPDAHAQPAVSSEVVSKEETLSPYFEL